MATILFLEAGCRRLPFPPFTWMPGFIWFLLKTLFMFFHVRHGQGDGAALSLRSVDAARLEGVSADCRWPWWSSSPRFCNSPVWRRNKSPMHGNLITRRARISPERVRQRVLPGDALFLQAEGDHQLSATRRTRSRRVFAASMRCAAIPTARSAASPASCARRSVRPRRSPSRPVRAATTAPAARRATTSTW